MARFGEIFGGFAGGLAGGLESGIALAQRQQAIDIQRAQADRANALSEIQILQQSRKLPPLQRKAFAEGFIKNVEKRGEGSFNPALKAALLSDEPTDAEKTIRAMSAFLEKNPRIGMKDATRFMLAAPDSEEARQVINFMLNIQDKEDARNIQKQSLAIQGGHLALASERFKLDKVRAAREDERLDLAQKVEARKGLIESARLSIEQSKLLLEQLKEQRAQAKDEREMKEFDLKMTKTKTEIDKMNAEINKLTDSSGKEFKQIYEGSLLKELNKLEREGKTGTPEWQAVYDRLRDMGTLGKSKVEGSVKRIQLLDSAKTIEYSDSTGKKHRLNPGAQNEAVINKETGEATVTAPDGTKVKIPTSQYKTIGDNEGAALASRAKADDVRQQINTLNHGRVLAGTMLDLLDVGKMPAGATGTIKAALNGTVDQLLTAAGAIDKKTEASLRDIITRTRNRVFDNADEDTKSYVIDPKLPAAAQIQRQLAYLVAEAQVGTGQRVTMEAVRNAEKQVGVLGMFGPGNETAKLKMRGIMALMQVRANSLGHLLKSQNFSNPVDEEIQFDATKP